MFPPQTGRTYFRMWSVGDLALALELWGDAEVTRLIDARGQFSDADVRARLEVEIRNQTDHGVCYWPVFQKGSDAFLGCAGLRPYGDDPGVRELGVQLKRTAWGQGYATEVSRAVIRYSFQSLRLDALFAGHNPANQGSRRLLAKLGFKWTHDELYEPTGLYHPSYRLPMMDWVEAT